MVRWFHCVACLLLLGPSRASSEWLVLRDGSRLEIAGTPETRGKQVHLRAPDGKRWVIRESEIDWAGTQAANAPQAPLAEPARGALPTGDPSPNPKPARSVAPREPVLRLTDDDVAHVEDEEEWERLAEEEDPAARSTASGAARPPQVVPPPPPIELFSTSWCGYCRKARALLTELGVPFFESDVEKDREARARRDRLTESPGVPVLALGREVVKGYNEERIRALAEKWKTAMNRHLRFAAGSGSS